MDYLHSVLCQVGLLRSRTNTDTFERTSGTVSLLVKAGELWNGKEWVGQPRPYGPAPVGPGTCQLRGDPDKLNDIDLEAWLADVLRRISDHPASRLHELLPWNWRKQAPESRLRPPEPLHPIALPVAPLQTPLFAVVLSYPARTRVR